MERSKKEKKELLPRFINKGGGSFRLRNGKDVRIIKPNQTFTASLEEIPAGIRDVIVPLNPILSEEDKDEIRGAESPVFEIQHKGGGRYNVVNAVGKIMNETGLLKEDAEKLKTDLEAGEKEEE